MHRTIYHYCSSSIICRTQRRQECVCLSNTEDKDWITSGTKRFERGFLFNFAPLLFSSLAQIKSSVDTHMAMTISTSHYINFTIRNPNIIAQSVPRTG